jgi:hypothetical protein
MKRILVVALTFAMLCTGCSTAWVSTLNSILAVAGPALINILQIVAIANNQPMNSALANKINVDAAAVKTLAADFAKASSNSAPGVCLQLEAAVSSYQADQQLVLQVAQVSDASTQTKITLLTDSIASTLGAITALIPTCADTTDFQMMKTAPSESFSTFAARYNSILVAKTGNAAVDTLTPKLKLHEHSKFVRMVSMGSLR